LRQIVAQFDTKMLDVLKASSFAYRDDVTLKRRAFYTCGYSGDRIEEPDHKTLQRAVWWLRYRERLSKADAWLVVRHGGFSACARVMWGLGTRNNPWNVFKRSWRAASRPQEGWSTRKPHGTRWRRRRPDEPLYSRRSDYLAVWNFIKVNPGMTHRQLREAQAGLTGRYVHLRLQAALEHLEALGLLNVARGGNGKPNRYTAHRPPCVLDADRAFTNSPRQGMGPDHTDSGALMTWLDPVLVGWEDPREPIPRPRPRKSGGRVTIPTN
jgi:hypothetical protein